jgi:hypothetical protein
MKKTTVILILTLCCFITLAKNKKSNLASKAASIDGFPFTLEELQDIKDSDSKYILEVKRGTISLKNKESNIRLFIKFIEKRSKKAIYTGEANFLFIAEKEKIVLKTINMPLKKLCPS